MTVVEERTRHTALTRVLHWLTAILVFTMLMIGFVMVNSLEDYARLVVVHKSLGVVILVVVLVRIVNRLTHRAPALPATVGSIERKLVVATELSLYALLVAQPLVGWAMVSASGRPVVVFGSVRLPSIAPLGAELFRCCAKPIRSSRSRWWSGSPRMYRRCCCTRSRSATACCPGWPSGSADDGRACLDLGFVVRAAATIPQSSTRASIAHFRMRVMDVESVVDVVMEVANGMSQCDVQRPPTSEWGRR